MTDFVKTFGLIMADQKPYNEREQGDRTFAVEFYNQPPRSFKAGSYAKHYTHQSFRCEGRAACDLSGMVERIKTVKKASDNLMSDVSAYETDLSLG